MHLLGRSFTMVLNPGTPQARTVLSVPNYNFDYQKAYNLSTPIPVKAGDKLQVNCTYDPRLAQELPILRKAPSHFVTWGDGSSDEMCIGLAWTSTTVPSSPRVPLISAKRPVVRDNLIRPYPVGPTSGLIDHYYGDRSPPTPAAAIEGVPAVEQGSRRLAIFYPIATLSCNDPDRLMGDEGTPSSSRHLTWGISPQPRPSRAGGASEANRRTRSRMSLVRVDRHRVPAPISCGSNPSDPGSHSGGPIRPVAITPPRRRSFAGRRLLIDACVEVSRSGLRDDGASHPPVDRTDADRPDMPRM